MGLKDKKQVNKDYYLRRNLAPRLCSNCGVKLRVDCTRSICKKCYRFSDEYKQIRNLIKKGKRDGKRL